MKSLLALLAALATVLFLSACTSPATDGHAGDQHGTSSTAETAIVDAKPADFNDADVAFATNMIPHHQQAVAMSAMVPERSTNSEVVKLAAAISAAQGPEIETMKVLLVQWSGGEGPAGHDAGGMQMPGMTDDATMAKLESLKGAEFDTLWLQAMIGHHEGAIAMAKTELAAKAYRQLVTTSRLPGGTP